MGVVAAQPQNPVKKETLFKCSIPINIEASFRSGFLQIRSFDCFPKGKSALVLSH